MKHEYYFDIATKDGDDIKSFRIITDRKLGKHQIALEIARFMFDEFCCNCCCWREDGYYFDVHLDGLKRLDMDKYGGRDKRVSRSVGPMGDVRSD